MEETGIYIAHHRGFGFVRTEDREEDLFVPPDNGNGAMDGDTVRVRCSEAHGNRRAEALVLKVLKRANRTAGNAGKNRWACAASSASEETSSE